MTHNGRDTKRGVGFLARAHRYACMCRQARPRGMPQLLRFVETMMMRHAYSYMSTVVAWMEGGGGALLVSTCPLLCCLPADDLFFLRSITFE